MNTNLLDVWNLNSLWRLISSITVGDKLSIRGNLVQIDRNTPFISFKRKYYGDKREDVHQFVTYLFEITEHHLKEETYIKKNVESFLQNILNGIKALINLRETYCDDVRFLAIYNSSLEKISLLKHYYKNKQIEYQVFLDIESKIFMKQSPLISAIETKAININDINANNANNANNDNTNDIFKTPND